MAGDRTQALTPGRGLLVVLALGLAGCASEQGVRYVAGYDEEALPRGIPKTNPNSGGAPLVARPGALGTQDILAAAEPMLASLYSAPVFASARHWDGGSPVLAVGAVRNSSAINFDTEMLAKRLTAAIARGGKARLASAVTPAGGRSLAEVEAVQANAHEDVRAPLMPDYTLSAMILDGRDAGARGRPSTFILQLSLSDSRKGTPLWLEERTVSRQGVSGP